MTKERLIELRKVQDTAYAVFVRLGLKNVGDCSAKDNVEHDLAREEWMKASRQYSEALEAFQREEF